jgi:hypothetical protein
MNLGSAVGRPMPSIRDGGAGATAVPSPRAMAA